MNLGEKIRKLRNTRSYQDIGNAVNASATSIRDIEVGKTRSPNLYLVSDLAKLFDVNLAWLADDAMDWPPPVSTVDKVLDEVRATLVGGGFLGEMKPLERALLTCFRRLPPIHQVRVVEYVRGQSDAISVSTMSQADAKAMLNAAHDLLSQAAQSDRQTG